MNKLTKVTSLFLGTLVTAYAVPDFVQAQGLLSGASFRDIVQSIAKFINGSLIPILIMLGIIYFFWNLVHYIQNMNNSKKKDEFKKYTINALIGLFIMLSVWGIIGIGTGIFFNSKPFLPQLPTGEDTQTSSSTNAF